MSEQKWTAEQVEIVARGIFRQWTLDTHGVRHNWETEQNYVRAKWRRIARAGLRALAQAEGKT